MQAMWLMIYDAQVGWAEKLLRNLLDADAKPGLQHPI